MKNTTNGEATKLNIQDLVRFLDIVPAHHRKIMADEFKLSFEFLTVYHVTAYDNLNDIKINGLRSHASQQSYERPSAVYFFAEIEEISSRTLDILGYGDTDYAILAVNIPANAVYESMHWDGLFNVSFFTRSAVQYLGDIPVEWIAKTEA